MVYLSSYKVKCKEPEYKYSIIETDGSISDIDLEYYPRLQSVIKKVSTNDEIVYIIHDSLWLLNLFAHFSCYSI